MSVGPLVEPVADRLWHQILMRLARFRAWLLGGVYTAGALAVVLRDDGHVLLVKPRYRRGWGLPGGFMKYGEQAPDALQRELKEETGIAVEPGRLHDVYVQRRRRHIDHLYLVRVGPEQQPRRSARLEIAAIAWHPLELLPPLQREAHEALERIGGRP